ncbi:MAG: hypothetical protein OXB84_01680 [Halobacteriovoraceae bacterium]|nr:hypothetical protein [Halobacteriovoraceae bacterium]
MREFISPGVSYRGSVKQVRGVPGEYPWYFEFDDSYSVFDWGRMPDELPDKGKALAHFGRILFEYLMKNTSVKSTFLNLKKDNLMSIRPVSILRPRYDKGSWNYDVYRERPTEILLPLEVIFRFGVPDGSSFLKRASADYCRSLGLSRIPKGGEFLDEVVIEFTSKLEEEDRWVSYGEARQMAGLFDNEFDSLIVLSKKLARCLQKLFNRLGMDLWDGKFEFALGDFYLGQREFLLADSIGPDELRLSVSGCQLSKENIRRFYRGSDWHQALQKAKTMAKKRGEKDWRRICREELHATPDLLPEKNREIFSMMYQVLVNQLSREWEGVDIFPDAWSLDYLKTCLIKGDLQ